jgi:hypothetical protein
MKAQLENAKNSWRKINVKNQKLGKQKTQNQNATHSGHF